MREADWARLDVLDGLGERISSEVKQFKVERRVNNDRERAHAGGLDILAAIAAGAGDDDDLEDMVEE